MIHSVNIWFLSVLMCVACSGFAMAAETGKFRAIEFRGLRNLSKNEIVRHSGVRTGKDYIIVDLDEMKRALSGFGIIETFDLAERNGRLIITVKEKLSVLVAVLKKGDRVVPVEVDHRMRVISTRLRASGLPVLYIGEDMFAKGVFSSEAKAIGELIGYLKIKSDPLYDELRELYINDGSIIVTLTGRRTKFFLRPVLEDFLRLKYITGYFDHAGYYPEVLNVSGNRFSIR